MNIIQGVPILAPPRPLFMAGAIEEYKRLLRARYCRVASQCYEEAVEQSRKFWTFYEQINRDYCPDDPVFSIIRAGVALSTTADLMTFEAAAAGQGRILELLIGGEATASAVNRVSVQRAGTAITGNTVITPEKFNSRSPAAAGIYGQGGTQALVGNPMLSLPLNAFGGNIPWKAAPGEEIYYVNSEVVSVRSASGVSTVSSTGIFEEL